MEETNYPKNTLMKILAAIKCGMLTFHQANRIYGIPLSTLYIKAKLHTPEMDNIETESGLPAAQEKELCNWILKMAAVGYGRIKKNIPDIVKEILDKVNIKSHFENNRPSITWAYNFMTKHPELNMKIQDYSSSQKIRTNEKGIKTWFQQLEHFLSDEMGLNAKDFLTSKNSCRIYHCSEISFSLNGTDSEAEILQVKGLKNMISLGSKTKYQISVLGCVAASGHFCKPLIIYPGEFPAFDASDINPSDFHVASSDNGFISNNIFYDWLSNAFYPEIKDSVLFPIILFSDGLSIHLNLAVTQFCKDNNIIIYCFPPHTSHILQPLDISIYTQVKSNWNYTLRTWSESNPGSPLSKTNFLRIFDSVWRKSSKPEKVISGFRKAGLVPFSITNLCLPETTVNEEGLTISRQRLLYIEAVGIKRSLQIVEENLGDELKGYFKSWYKKSNDCEDDSPVGSLWRIYKGIRSALEDKVNQNHTNDLFKTCVTSLIEASNSQSYVANVPSLISGSQHLYSDVQSSSTGAQSSFSGTQHSYADEGKIKEEVMEMMKEEIEFEEEDQFDCEETNFTQLLNSSFAKVHDSETTIEIPDLVHNWSSGETILSLKKKNEAEKYDKNDQLLKKKKEEEEEGDDDDDESPLLQFSNGNQFERELENVHHLKKRRVSKCFECEYSTPNKCDLRKHVLNHSEMRMFRCFYCSYATNNSSNLKRHQRQHSELKSCMWNSNLEQECDGKRHKSNHEILLYECCKCGFGTNDESDFKVHELNHSKKKSFSCSKCDYSSFSHRALIRHKLNHLEINLFKCVKCDYTSRIKRDIKKHQLIHSDKKNLQCSECCYATNDNSNFKRHKKIHLKSKLFVFQV